MCSSDDWLKAEALVLTSPLRDFTVVRNPAWGSGQFCSSQRGVRAGSPESVSEGWKRTARCEEEGERFTAASAS